MVLMLFLHFNDLFMRQKPYTLYYSVNPEKAYLAWTYEPSQVGFFWINLVSSV